MESEGKNYGWQINDLGELEYLIQISPSMLRDMQDPVNKSDLESRIPRELVGRIKRVVVSIGNDTLPRTPLRDVERLMPATASLPTGKVQNLEGSIVNVNNPASDNGFSNFNQSTPPPINNSAATTPLGSAFMDSARGNQQPASGSLLDRFTGSGQVISGTRNATGNALGSTANSRTTTNGNNWNASNGYPNNGYPNNGATGGSYANGNYDRLADSRYGQPSNGYAGTQDTLGSSRWNDPNSLSNNGATGYGQNGNAQAGYGQGGTLQNSNLQNGYGQGTYAQGANGQNGYGTNGAYGPLRNDVYANNYNNGVNGQSTLTNGGNRFSALGNPTYGNDSNYANSGYGNRNGSIGTSGFGDSYGQYGGPLLDNRRLGSLADYSGANGASAYLAQAGNNRTELPSTNPQAIDRNYAAQAQRAGTQGYPNPNYPPQENNTFYYVFFILSIAINLWMVHLLRSLYLRYRSLLSSLRSQATTLN